jgi:iron(III) transport system ATP-binding protein
MLAATHLTKSFDTLTAVRNVSLMLEPGQMVALVGASGSGKSTLLNLLAGLLDADKGSVTFDDLPVAGPKDVLVAGHPQIRVVHQEYKLMPNVSIRENIAYALRFYERTYRERRVEQLLRLCRLEAVQHHKPREASGGEKQRTAIARAIAEPARVLLLDEPFSHLDLPNRLIVRDLLFDLVRSDGPVDQRTACLFVTHEATDALSLADTIGILQQGRLVQWGTPRQVYAAPANAYAARMTGPVNIVRGKHLPLLGTLAEAEPEACFGLRPEYAHLDPTGPVEGTIRAVFFQGRITEIDVQIARYVTIRLLTNRADIRVGDTVRVRLDTDQLVAL